MVQISFICGSLLIHTFFPYFPWDIGLCRLFCRTYINVITLEERANRDKSSAGLNQTWGNLT